MKTPDGTGASRASRHQVALAATLACVLEASAEKIGNVTPARRFADSGFGDFVVSAVALGPAIAQARPRRVGWAVWKSVATARRATATNTHLGVALLFSPLVAAWRSPRRGGLRGRLAEVLRGLTVGDARWAYRAIRLAKPGGLGRSDEADALRSPTITLREAMALAAQRDAIAWEYVHDFAITFDLALPVLFAAVRRGLTLLDAIAQAHLELMGRLPDTLIMRKAGRSTAEAISVKAQAVLEAGGFYTRQGRRAAGRLDRDLREEGNRLNPGTSADLIAAALFVWLLEADGRGRG